MLPLGFRHFSNMRPKRQQRKSGSPDAYAGYSMTYRRTFRIGDRVKIGEDVGGVATNAAARQPHPHSKKRGSGRAQLDDPGYASHELQLDGSGTRTHLAHHSGHWLRNPVASSGSDVTRDCRPYRVPG